MVISFPTILYREPLDLAVFQGTSVGRTSTAAFDLQAEHVLKRVQLG